MTRVFDECTPPCRECLLDECARRGLDKHCCDGTDGEGRRCGCPCNYRLRKTETAMKTEKLLFATIDGLIIGRAEEGVGFEDRRLPLAVCCHGHIEACWNARTPPDEFHNPGWFFYCLGIGAAELPDGPGLWVYELTHAQGRLPERRDESGSWSHLCGGTLRRPTVEEATRLAAGEAPWPGGVML